MTAQFVITQAGYQAASTASPQGPHINITGFRVGSGYGYQPNSNTDTALHGATLYSGIPTSYAIYSHDTTQFICELPAEAGPFEFGEIGLYMGDTLFALAAFPTRRTKLNISVNGQPHLISFRCLIKLGQSPAVFNVTTTTTLNLFEVPSFALVPPPSATSSGINAIIVHEESVSSDSTLLVKHSNNRWTMLGGWEYLGDSTVAGFVAGTLPSGSGPAFTAAARYRNLLTLHGGYSGKAAILIQNDQGLIRSVSTGSGWWTGANFPNVSVGDVYRVYVQPIPRSIQEAEDRLPLGLWTDVNRLIGPPQEVTVRHSDYMMSGQIPGQEWVGWGGTPIATPPPRGVTSTHVSALGNALVTIDRQTGFSQLGVATNFGNFSNLVDVIPRYSPALRGAIISNAYALINHAYKHRYDPPRSALEWRFATGRSYINSSTNPWQEIRVGIVASFPHGQARSFFLAGGYIDFTVRCTATSYVEWVIQKTFSQLGPIRFKYRSVESMGPLKIKSTRGDGMTTSPGLSGFEGSALAPGSPSNIHNRLWYYDTPLHPRKPSSQLALAGGYGRGDESLVVEIYGRFIDLGSTDQLTVMMIMRQTSIESPGGGIQQPGYQPGISSALEFGPIADYDERLYGASVSQGYLPSDPAWRAPNQRLNAYMFLGRSRYWGHPFPAAAFTGTGGSVISSLTSQEAEFAGANSANT